jgi:hypothetical protein
VAKAVDAAAASDGHPQGVDRQLRGHPLVDGVPDDPA